MDYGPSSGDCRGRVRRIVCREGPPRLLTSKSRWSISVISILFQPLLYQVATGELSPADVAFPYAPFSSGRRMPGCCCRKWSISIRNARHVVLKDGQSVGYDSLVVATGAKNHYFGNDQWAEFATGLKSLGDATRIRHRILYAFEAAEKEPDPVEAASVVDLRGGRRGSDGC